MHSTHTCLLGRFGDSARRERERERVSGGDGDDGGAHARGSLDRIAGDGSECTLHDRTQQDGVSKSKRGSLGEGDKMS